MPLEVNSGNRPIGRKSETTGQNLVRMNLVESHISKKSSK